VPRVRAGTFQPGRDGAKIRRRLREGHLGTAPKIASVPRRRRRLLDAELQALLTDPAHTAIFCDFDGSLAEIVEDPEEAGAVDGAAEVLSRLAARLPLVAVISGRALASLEPKVNAPGVRLLGLYGIERSLDGTVEVLPEAAGAREKIERASHRIAAAIAGHAGVYLEHKGLSVATHFRRAHDPDAAEAELESVVRSIAAGERLSVIRGRRVLEVRPRVSMDKGEATRRLIEEHGIEAAITGGDDVGDQAMFEAVSSLPRALRVVIESDETPTALIDLADVRVPSPHAFVEILESCASMLGA
jgi:trehalose 6-phosphate phosphatase